MNAYEKLIMFFGTQNNIAKAVKVSQPAISYWRINGISSKKVILLERLTKGFVKRFEMRPDLYPQD